MAKKKTDSASAKKKPAGSKMWKNIGMFMGFWTLVTIVAAIITSVNSSVIATILIVATISFVMMMAGLLSQWEGSVTRLEEKEETRQKGKYGRMKYKVTYAYLNLKNGKTKSMKLNGWNVSWKVGDRIRKERGEYGPKNLSR